MNKYSMDIDDVFLVVLRLEEERDLSFAIAKAALVDERWQMMENDTSRSRTLKTIPPEVIGERYEHKEIRS